MLAIFYAPSYVRVVGASLLAGPYLSCGLSFVLAFPGPLCAGLFSVVPSSLRAVFSCLLSA